MSTLSDGLAARDKLRSSSWNITARKDVVDDALDWIAKALPWMKARALSLDLQLGALNRIADIYPKASNLVGDIPLITAELATLTALIAQAEGQKEGEK